jgi:hypothetical protein
MSSAFTPTAFIAAALLCSGCSVINEFEDPTLVGSWKGDNASPADNDMDIELDGKGDAKLFLSAGGTNFEVGYDIKWEQIRDNKFELKHECDQSKTTVDCAGLDVEFECKVNTDGDELECDTETPNFSGVVLEWKD